MGSDPFSERPEKASDPTRNSGIAAQGCFPLHPYTRGSIDSRGLGLLSLNP